MDKKMISERIDLLISMLGLSLKEFSEGIGEDVGYIREIINGRKEVSELLIKQISEKYGINGEWIKNGIGEVFHTKTLNNGKKMIMNFYSDIEWDCSLRGKQLIKALKVLDIIRDGDPVSMKDALMILDIAKDILLDYKMA